ncbi:hypothetical protein DSECCO2_491160 [anaerobic digester metagenome]|uniref:hypothetical protein n=1 Tax=Solidesulfovibrio alcoholivorans TaxID=81406 RepID=UPI0005C153DD|nr:hypothetical protein [Solidesulfovibrio alcoholivorans]
MTPFWRIVLAGAGLALLAASLLRKKRAGWLAVAGVVLLGTLAVRESDPLLALGALALAAARCVSPARQDSPQARTADAEAAHPPRGQRP